MSDSPKTLFYPNLGSAHDFWFFRVAGAGIGNGLYNYFHAVVLAEQYGGEVISPPWVSLKLGTILRGERSKRFYFNVFKPYSKEIYGRNKLYTMLATFSGHNIAMIDGVNMPHVEKERLNIVTCKKFTFAGLYEHREKIRSRLLAIIKQPLPEKIEWGSGGYIAVHVRLGDFVVAKIPEQINVSSNTRISLSWYKNVISALLIRFPDMPVRIFSDGKAEELKEFTELGASVYQSGSDIGDLLALSSASILVGSNSTYSYWAAFLGAMPSVWLDSDGSIERAIDGIPAANFVPLDAMDITFSF